MLNWLIPQLRFYLFHKTVSLMKECQFIVLLEFILVPDFLEIKQGRAKKCLENWSMLQKMKLSYCCLITCTDTFLTSSPECYSSEMNSKRLEDTSQAILNVTWNTTMSHCDNHWLRGYDRFWKINCIITVAETPRLYVLMWTVKSHLPSLVMLS